MKTLTFPRVKTPKGDILPQYAFHIITPALNYRVETGDEVPVMCLRLKSEGFHIAHLFNVLTAAKVSIRPLFDNPLPGTGGRGLAICLTEGPVTAEVVWGTEPITVDTTDGRRKNEDIWAEIARKYKEGRRGIR